MQRYRILDMDNCISDDGWRIPLIDWSKSGDDRYHHYHTVAPHDMSGNHDLFKGVDESILIITSRPVRYRDHTEAWLKRHNIPYLHLIMRNNHDRRSSVEVKRSAILSLHDYGVDLARITCAYDDRPEICKMYEEHGVPASVRSIHNVCAYVNPRTGINHADGSQAAR